MVLELLAYRQRNARRDAELGEVRRRTDPGAQQNRRRVHRARTQQHDTRAEILPCATVQEAYADGALAFDEHALDVGVADDLQVRRARLGSRYASFVLTRTPSRLLIAYGETPSACGAL